MDTFIEKIVVPLGSAVIGSFFAYWLMCKERKRTLMLERKLELLRMIARIHREFCRFAKSDDKARWERTHNLLSGEIAILVDCYALFLRRKEQNIFQEHCGYYLFIIFKTGRDEKNKGHAAAFNAFHQYVLNHREHGFWSRIRWW